MIRLETRAQKYLYVPLDIETNDNPNSWVLSKRFWCNLSGNTSSQNVRAGKNSNSKTFRMTFNTREVSFQEQDRILINGVTFMINYVDKISSTERLSFCDIEELDR